MMLKKMQGTIFHIFRQANNMANCLASLMLPHDQIFGDDLPHSIRCLISLDRNGPQILELLMHSIGFLVYFSFSFM